MKEVLFVEGLGFVRNIVEKGIEFSETVDAACRFVGPSEPLIAYIHTRFPDLRAKATIWPLRMMRPNEVFGPCYAFVENCGFATTWSGFPFDLPVVSMEWCQTPLRATLMSAEKFARVFGSRRHPGRMWGLLLDWERRGT